jgi:hypothetical protein
LLPLDLVPKAEIRRPTARTVIRPMSGACDAGPFGHSCSENKAAQRAILRHAQLCDPMGSCIEQQPPMDCGNARSARRALR